MMNFLLKDNIYHTSVACLFISYRVVFHLLLRRSFSSLIRV